MRLPILLLVASFAIACHSPHPLVDSVQPLQGAHGNIFCTAFSINEHDGLWATARHCIEPVVVDPLAEPVEPAAPYTLAGYWAETIYLDEHWDIGVLQSVHHAPALPLDRARLAQGDPVVVWGYPLGLAVLVRTEGHVGARHELLNGGRLSNVFDVTIARDNSGSPVLKNGRVVAVLWGVMNESPLALGSPDDALRRALEPFVRP